MSSSESEEADEYQTQSTQTQKGKRKQKQGEDDLQDDIRENLVADVVRFILSKDSAKLPIKKTDISTKVMKDYKRHTSDVMTMAQDRLSNVFGMTLLEVDAKTKGTYILVSPFSPTEIDEFINTKSASQETEAIVLMSTLSLIELSNGKIDIEKALEALGKMGLEKLEHKDKIKNEKYWEHLVRTNFQKQLYIRSVKESGQGRDITFIFAGFRTSHEIGRINVNKYIAKLFGEEMDDIRLKEIENEEADKANELLHAKQSTQTQSRSRNPGTQSQSQTPTQRGRKQQQSQAQSQVQSQTPTQKRKQSQAQSQQASQSSQSQSQSQSQSNRGSATKKARRG
jgi:hypothetical protein